MAKTCSATVSTHTHAHIATTRCLASRFLTVKFHQKLQISEFKNKKFSPRFEQISTQLLNFGTLENSTGLLHCEAIGH